jgi:hypothetical protein
MTKQTSNGRWYPPNISDPATHEAFRQAFDRLYAVTDHIGMTGQPAQKGAAPTATAPPSPAASLTPAMSISAPVSSAAPGVLTNIYWDATYIYVYTPSGWRRAALSSF